MMIVSISLWRLIRFVSFHVAKVQQYFNIPNKNIKNLQYILIFRNIYKKCPILRITCTAQ